MKTSKISAGSRILSVILIISIFLSMNVTTLAKQSRYYNFSTNYTLTGNNADDIVAVAKAQLGKTESNLGYTEAWCADFVNDCAKLAKISDNIIPYNYSGSAACTSLYNYMLNNCNATKVTTRKKGDLVFYYCSACGRYVHVGIVQDSTTSIEGNYSNKVSKVTSSYTHISNGTTHSTSNGKVTRKYLRPQYVPAAPTISTVKATDATEITIKWNSVSGADSYIVQGRKAGDTYATIAEVTSTSYVHENLEGGRLYWYRVQAKNSSGKSSYSTASGAYTKPATPTASTTGTNSIEVNWSSSGGSTNYELLARKAGEEEYITIAENIEGYTYTHTGLEAGTQYYYKIKAHNKEHAYIFSGRSDSATAITNMNAPKIEAVTADKVTLNWERGALNGAYTYTYKVRRKEINATNYTSIETVSGSYYTDYSVKPNTTYKYYIDLLRDGSSAVHSKVVTVTTDKQPATAITLNSSEVLLPIGATYKLSSSISPVDTTDKTVTWTSSNSDVVAVSGGTITAKNVGIVTIAAKTVNGLTATCTVTVDTQENLCEHIFGEWNVTKEATCSEYGERNRSCSECGKEEAEILDILEHEYSDEWTVTKEATCSEHGEKAHLCVLCGTEDSSTIESVDTIDHTLADEWTIKTEATCSEIGLRVKTCTICGQECESQEIPTISHQYDDSWTIEQIATCQQERIEYCSCSICGEKEYRYSEKTEHDYVVTDTKDSTYAEEGYATYTCSYCGDSYKDIIPVITNEPEIIVESIKAKAGETIDVAIKISNNPGIASAKLKVKYDESVLTLKNVTDAGVLGSTAHSPSLASPYVLYWNNGSATENFTVNGTIATLTFEVKAETENGVYPITLGFTEEDIFDVNLDAVRIYAVGGEIEIMNTALGDLNEDGKVNVKDNMILSRFIAEWPDYNEDTVCTAVADLNNDGKINVKDDMILARHIAEWPGYDILPYVN